VTVTGNHSFRRRFPSPRPVERFALGIFLALLLAGMARAQTPATPEEQAAAHLDAGNAKLDQGDLAGAVAEYQAGFALYPRASLLFNIGVAELRQEHWLEAAAAFEGAQGRPDTTPEVAEQAREQLERAEGKLTRLEVKVAPSSDAAGAALGVDGEARGTLPLPRPLRLLPGVHAVRAIKDGYLPFERQISGAPGSRVELAITALDPLPPPAKPRPRYWLWGTLGAAVAAAAVIGIVAATRHGDCPVDSCLDFSGGK
jgi:tetratricopeptide (TPR) repeat protein